jgi:hypothetical protein
MFVQMRGKPARGQFDTSFLDGTHLFVEAGKVLLAPIVGIPVKAQSRKHLRSLFRTALLGVEGNDAPGDQILASINIGDLLSILRSGPFRLISRHQPSRSGYTKGDRQNVSTLRELPAEQQILSNLRGRLTNVGPLDRLPPTQADLQLPLEGK